MSLVRCGTPLNFVEFRLLTVNRSKLLSVMNKRTKPYLYYNYKLLPVINKRTKQFLYYNYSYSPFSKTNLTENAAIRTST